MKYANFILTLILIALVIIYLKLNCLEKNYSQESQVLIKSNQELSDTITGLREDIRPVIKRFFKR